MDRSDQVFNTLRLSSRDIQRVLEDLERRSLNDQAGIHRESRRWIMRTQRVIVTVVREMNQRMHFVVAPRNLSRGGMAFLSGNYLHVGSKCFVTLRSFRGKGMVVPATVRRCQHLAGRLHDVGVEFDDRVDPQNFLIETNGQYMFNAEKVEVADLEGMVLVVSAEPFEQRLIGHYFSDSNIDLVFASSGEQAMQMLDLNPDLAFVDIDLPDQSGFEFVASARERGFTAPVLLLSAEESDKMRGIAFDEGANEILFKPVSPELMHRATAEYLLAAAEQRRAELSSVESVERATGIGKAERTDYAAELRNIAELIQKAYDAGDLDTIESKLKVMKSSAQGYGFPGVAKLAKSTLSAMGSAKNSEWMKREIRRLVRDLKTVNAA
ncbi:MAG: response regulator [Phycisphaerales bacterium]